MAVALPIPEFAPVTRAFWPCRSRAFSGVPSSSALPATTIPPWSLRAAAGPADRPGTPRGGRRRPDAREDHRQPRGQHGAPVPSRFAYPGHPGGAPPHRPRGQPCPERPSLPGTAEPLWRGARASLTVGLYGHVPSPPSTSPQKGHPSMAVTTTDHAVPHTSTVPANKGQQVELFVREHDGTPPGHAGDRT